MTKSELLKAVENGEPVTIVEYRGSNAETIHWRDKDTKQAMDANILGHTVENARGSLRVSERVPESFKPDAYKPAFKKGDRVVLRFTNWQTQKGVTTVAGALEPYDASK